MPSCERYEITVTPKDSSYPLLEAVQKEKISWEAIDQGIPAPIDYRYPATLPKKTGQGDCKITAEELQKYVVERWQKYAEPIEKWRGVPLQWKDFSPSPVWGPFLAVIEKSMADIPPERRDEAKALAIFWWNQFPKKETWEIFSETQKEEWRQKISELRDLGAGSIAEYLQNSGGEGRYFQTWFMTSPQKGETSFQIGQAARSDDLNLYFYLKLAGVDAHLVKTVSNIEKNPDLCDAAIGIGTGAALLIGQRWRVFQPSLENVHAETTAFYPLTLNQFLSETMPTEKMMEWVQSKVRLLETITEENWEKTLDENRWDPYVFLAILGKTRMSSQYSPREKREFLKMLQDYPLLPPITRDFITMGISTDFQREKTTRKFGEKILKKDPECLMAIEMLGSIHANGESLEEGQKFFELAEALASDSQQHSRSFYTSWGRIHMEAGRYPQAVEIFEKHLKRPDLENDDRLMGHLYLALAHAKNGEPFPAIKNFKSALQIPTPLSKEKIESVSRRWRNVMKEDQPEESLPKPLLAQLYRKMGDNHAYAGNLDEAKEWYEAGLKLLPEDAAILERLQEIECLVKK